MDVEPKNRGVYPQNGWWKWWKTLLKWMIWGYPYFQKHPCREIAISSESCSCLVQATDPEIIEKVSKSGGQQNPPPIRAYQPLVSLNKALLNPYFWGVYVRGGLLKCFFKKKEKTPALFLHLSETFFKTKIQSIRDGQEAIKKKMGKSTSSPNDGPQMPCPCRSHAVLTEPPNLG